MPDRIAQAGQQDPAGDFPDVDCRPCDADRAGLQGKGGGPGAELPAAGTNTQQGSSHRERHDDAAANTAGLRRRENRGGRPALGAHQRPVERHRNNLRQADVAARHRSRRQTHKDAGRRIERRLHPSKRRRDAATVRKYQGFQNKKFSGTRGGHGVRSVFFEKIEIIRTFGYNLDARPRRPADELRFGRMRAFPGAVLLVNGKLWQKSNV